MKKNQETYALAFSLSLSLPRSRSLLSFIPFSINESNAVTNIEQPLSPVDGSAILTWLVHFPNDLQALLGINFNLHSQGIEGRVT